MDRSSTLRLLLSLCLPWLSVGCNGAVAFCDLPFTKFTFPGTHNSNSYSLDIPELIPDEIPGVDVNEVLRCYFENHDLNLVEQLNFGIRSFMLDLCGNEAVKPGALFNCHGQPGARAWRGEFEEDLDGIHSWLTVHPRELIVLAVDNMDAGSGANSRWLALVASKFGGPCIELDQQTDVSSWYRRSEVACAVVAQRPNDNVTLGQLMNNNFRAVILQTDWRDLFLSTYDGNVNPGATSQSLLEDFTAYAQGYKAMLPNSLLLFQVFGSAKMPSMDAFNACADPLCKAAAALEIKDDLELSCVKTMSTRFNRDLLQDDMHPHEYFSGEQCPEYACGCLGYRSPLEVVHQKLLEDGHYIQSVFVDYPEVGERSNVAEVAARMNEANLRHFRGEPEVGADWWSCHWQAVLAVGIPVALLLLCAIYAGLALCYPRRYGVCIRKAWRAYQDRQLRRKIGEERGRQEAMAYLQSEGLAGGPDKMAMSMPQQIPPASVAPSAGYPPNYQMSYQMNCQASYPQNYEQSYPQSYQQNFPQQNLPQNYQQNYPQNPMPTHQFQRFADTE